MGVGAAALLPANRGPSDVPPILPPCLPFVPGCLAGSLQPSNHTYAPAATHHSSSSLYVKFFSIRRPCWSVRLCLWGSSMDTSMDLTCALLLLGYWRREMGTDEYCCLACSVASAAAAAAAATTTAAAAAAAAAASPSNRAPPGLSEGN